MPVFVDEGRTIGDSGAITQYLDLAYAERPSIWPRGAGAAHETLAITTAIDAAMNILVDVGTRYWDLHGDPAWKKVADERLTRAQLALDFVASKADRPILAGDSWGAADMWTFSATLWVAGLPSRAVTNPHIAQIVGLGLRLPDALVSWAKLHEGRADVRAIYG
jgi:glutathione S-transferase